MRRSRKSSRVAPASTEVTEKSLQKNEQPSNCLRDRSPISAQIRGVGKLPCLF